MKNLLQKDWVHYLIYVAVALIGIWFLTKLWIPEGYAVAGHDSGLAINAGEFLKSRLFAWDLQGFGRDNSGYFGSLVMHSVDFISSKMAGVQFAGNQLNLFFWIAAIFISAAVFARSLNNKLGVYFQYLFPVFITFNFFILQSIFIVERAKYSLLVAALLFLAIFIKMRSSQLSVLMAGISATLVFFFFNGGSWLGLPLYGGVFVLGLSILIFEIVFAFKQKKTKNLVKLLTFYLILGIGFVFLNAYSILPYSSKFFSQDYSAATDKVVISTNKGWLNNLSQASSYLNLFRLQGTPDWYAGEMDANPGHSYANIYINNPFLVASSFAIPLLIIFSFLLTQSGDQKEKLTLFGVIFFLGLFFSAGSHPPLGFVYTFFYEHVPGFSIFRSPFYKFGSALFIGASVMISFSISILAEKFANLFKNKYKYFYGLFPVLLAIILWFLFYGVLFKPSLLFTWQPQLSTRLTVPEYVNNFATWFGKQETGDSRTLLLPQLNDSWKDDSYTWGYWSLTNLPSVISNKPFVSNGELSKEEEMWVDRLYLFLAKGDEIGAYNLSKRLGIDYLLLRNDVLVGSTWSGLVLPGQYRTKLESLSSIEKIAVFDKWSIYKFKRENTPLFYSTKTVVSITGNYPYLSQEFYSNVDTVSGTDPSSLSGYVSEIVNENACKSCPLEGDPALTSLPAVTILPNSPFYILKQRNEDRALKNAVTDRSKIDAYLGSVLRKGAEIKAMWDMGLHTDYAVDSLAKINEYLKQTSKIYSSGNADQYFEGKRLIDNLNVVERAFKEIAVNYDFKNKKLDYRQGIFDAIWNINSLKSQFPIIEDKNKLETEKIYNIKAKDGGNRMLYIDENTLPLGLNLIPVLPEKITYVSDKKSSDVKIEQTATSLLKLKMPENYGEGEIQIKFPRFPNLFVNQGLKIEQTPTGQRSCIEGTLTNFNPDRKYRVEVSAVKPWQVTKVYIKDGEINGGDSHFIQGQDEAEIGPTLSNKPFYHVYTPSHGATSPSIYLCSSNVTPPEIENFEIHEMVSPDIIAVDSISTPDIASPVVTYTKVDPTHFQVKIENASTPFILVFNEAYNSSWRLNGYDSGHFVVNGYANAWKISKTGTYTLDLTYTPQSSFKKGVLISIFSLVFVLGAFITLVFRRAKIN